MAKIILTCDNSSSPKRKDSMDEQLSQIRNQGIEYDLFSTPKQRKLAIGFIKHASLIFDLEGYMIYIDPVTMYGNDYSKLPKADLLLVTHEHHDHYDPKAIGELSDESTQFIADKDVVAMADKDIVAMAGKGEAVEPGDEIDDVCENFTILATPAYNITPEHLQYHPKERKDVGFLFDIDGLKIYVSGDTEDIPEMNNLKDKDVDIAFLATNQPYTMTPEQTIHAIDMIKPKIVYPYHYGETDLSPIVNHFKDDKNVEIRIRPLE